jgi:hypothetical protein
MHRYTVTLTTGTRTVMAASLVEAARLGGLFGTVVEVKLWG